LLEEKLGYKQMAQARFEKADKLIKAEDALMSKIDELEGKNNVNLQAQKSAAKSEVENIEMVETKRIQIIRKVLTDRKQFKAFLKFVKNGLKE